MAKKLICFPFIDGNLQEYSRNNLNDSERERVYNGEEVVTDLYPNSTHKEIWKPNTEVELTLHYNGYGRGRSAVTFYWLDDDGLKECHVQEAIEKIQEELLCAKMVPV